MCIKSCRLQAYLRAQRAKFIAVVPRHYVGSKAGLRTSSASISADDAQPVLIFRCELIDERANVLLGLRYVKRRLPHSRGKHVTHVRGLG